MFGCSQQAFRNSTHICLMLAFSICIFPLASLDLDLDLSEFQNESKSCAMYREFSMEMTEICSCVGSRVSTRDVTRETRGLTRRSGQRCNARLGLRSWVEQLKQCAVHHQGYHRAHCVILIDSHLLPCSHRLSSPVLFCDRSRSIHRISLLVRSLHFMPPTPLHGCHELMLLHDAQQHLARLILGVETLGLQD